jgi:hypothetical protein
LARWAETGVMVALNPGRRYACPGLGEHRAFGPSAIRNGCDMDEDHIRQMIETLEASTESGSGKSRLTACGPRNEVFLTANRAGLLRLAYTLLRTALEPVLGDDCRSKPVDLSDNIEQTREDASDQLLAFVQRMEAWPEPAEVKRRSRWNWQLDRVALLGCGLVAFILAFVFIAGVIAIWKVAVGP